MSKSSLRQTAATIGAAALIWTSASCSDSSGPTFGPPSVIEIVAGQAQTAGVAVQLPTPLRVRVVDAEGRAVRGASVSWSVRSGGGAVTAADGSTAADGTVEAVWTLGPTAGEHVVSATVPGVDQTALEATFEATAVPGEPDSIAIVAGDDQSAGIGTTLPEALVVAVMDRYANPVAGVPVRWRVAGGGGSVTPAQVETDEFGRAAAEWQLGQLGGTGLVTAAVFGVTTGRFTSRASDPLLNLTVEAVHLNQGNQDLHGTIGGVAGRPGLLRILLRANRNNAAAPDVRVRLHRGGTMIREEILSATGVRVPTDPGLRDLNTYDLALAASAVVPGLSVDVLVDPGGTIVEADRSDNAFPQAGGTADLDVQDIPDLNIVFIPIVATTNGTTGDVNAGNTDAFLGGTRRLIPTSVISPTMHAPFTTSEDLGTSDGWRALLADIQAVRTLEAATDAYYHGIIGDFDDINYGGLGYVPTQRDSRFRAALSYDRHPHAEGTVAHELGHNLGRPHSPCGDVGDFDPEYPHIDGRIGPPGYDIDRDRLVTGGAEVDYMSYCAPKWVSDYTYSRTLEWRRDDPLAQQATALPSLVAPSTGLLLWGRISGDAVTLNPAFTLEGIPAMPAGGGPNVLRGVAADGTEVFRFSFTAVTVADSEVDERHFAFFVPLSSARIDALESVHVATPQGAAAQTAGAQTAAGLAGLTGGAGDEPRVTLEADGASRARVQWNATVYPMAMVRDPGTGEVLAFLRGGDAGFATGSRSLDRLEILLSDGARSRPVRPGRE